MRLFQVTSGPTTTRFAYDGLAAIAEFDASYALMRRYVHGPGMDEPLVQYEGAGTSDRRFLSSDERGSIVAVTDSAGNLIAANSYDEYGIPGSGNTGRFQYTGQMWLPEVGVYHYKARAYSPTLGRFLQTDPIGYADGMNIYAYTGNDPVNFTDPLGLEDGGTITVTGIRDAFKIFNAQEITRDLQLALNQLRHELERGLREFGKGESDEQCESPPVSDGERAAADRGDRRAFWKSRLERGDPLARTALDILDNKGFSALWANSKLTGAIRNANPSFGPESIRYETNSIGVDLMRAHVGSVDRGSTGPRAIARYHYSVFSDHRLSPKTFGAGFLTGTPDEASSWDSLASWSGC